MSKLQDRRKKIKRTKIIIRGSFCIICLCITIFSIQMITKGIAKVIATENGEISPKVNETKSNTSSNQEEDIKSSQLVVCLDAGHGGKDVGGSQGKRYEKDDCLAITQKIKSYLEEKDVKVIMTRDKDVYPSLKERCEIANKEKVDLFVSVHRNTGGQSGVEAWVNSSLPESSVTLATNIMQALEIVGIERNRGVRGGTANGENQNYFINSNVDAPSCILELGFIDNKGDNELFDTNIEAYAKAVGDGILTFANIEKKEVELEPTDQAPEDQTPEDVILPEIQPPVQNVKVDNIEALDGKGQDWGFGNNCDELNRPVDSLGFQEKYGHLSVDFINTTQDTSQKNIYLTLDEGYENGYTGQILDVLKEKQCRAVFFVTKPYVTSNMELVKRMIDEGHIVGNHSVTHPANGLPSQTLAEQEKEVMDLHQYMLDTFAYEMKLFRYPAGKFSEQSLALLNNLNYKSLFWSFAYYDYNPEEQPEAEKALEKLNAKLHPGAIYLLHAVSKTNTEILGTFIDNARAQGYTFQVYE